LSYGAPGYAVNYQVRLNVFLLVMQRTLQVRFGSKAEILNTSTKCLLCTRKRTSTMAVVMSAKCQ
jgi:hypothetical protein